MCSVTLVLRPRAQWEPGALAARRFCYRLDRMVVRSVLVPVDTMVVLHIDIPIAITIDRSV